MKHDKKLKLLVKKDGESWDFLVSEEGFTIGRTFESPVCVPIGTLSRSHLEFKSENGDWFFWDLGSSNGTFFEGMQLQPHQKQKATFPLKLTIGQKTEIEIHLFTDQELKLEEVSTVEKAKDFWSPAAQQRKELEIEMKYFEQKKAENNKVIDELRSKRLEFEKSILKLKEEISEVEVQKTLKLEELKVLNEDFDSLKNGIQSKEELLNSYESRMRNIEEESGKAQLAVEDFQKKLEILNTQQLEKELELKNQRNELLKLVHELDELWKTREARRLEIVHIENDMELLRKTKTKLVEELDIIRAEKSKTIEAANESQARLLRSSEETKHFHLETTKLTKELEVLKKEILDRENECKWKDQEVSKMNHEVNTLSETRENRRAEIIQIDEQLNHLKNHYEKLREELEAGRLEKQKYSDQLISAQTQIHNLSEQHHDLKEKNRILLEEISLLEKSQAKHKSESARALQEYQTSETQLQQLKISIRACEELNQRLQTTQQSLNVELQLQEERLKRTLADLENSELRLVEVQDNFNALTEQRAALDEEIQLLQEQQRKLNQEFQLALAKTKADTQIFEKAEKEKLNARFVMLAEKQERELAERARQSAQTLAQAEKTWKEKQDNKRPSEIREIVKASDRLLEAHISKFIGDPSNLSSIRDNFRKDIQDVVQTVLLSEGTGTIDAKVHSRSLLASAPDVAKATIKYWEKRGTQLVTALGAIALLIVFPEIPRYFVSGISERLTRKPATSDSFVEGVRSMREKRPKFLPTQDRIFKNTVTDNLIYLLGYKELKLNEEVKKVWIRELNEFFQKNLELDDRVIVSYLSLEGPMISEMVAQTENMSLETYQLKIEKMREIESQYKPRMILVLVKEENYLKMKQFEQNFYERTMQRLDSVDTESKPDTSKP